MRWCMSIGAMLVMGAMADCIAAPIQKNEFADTRSAAFVDLELVIAVDVSYSMETEELALQREGYAQALERILASAKKRPKGQDGNCLFRVVGVERSEGYRSMACD